MSIQYSKWPFGTTQFREYVNEHADILIRLSEEQDEQDFWNCVCSAMDWMDLAIEQLEVLSIDKINWHRYSLQIYMYISFIDIIWESIKQLHKMFIEGKTIPYENDNSIFQDTRLGLDDNRYFMHVRAAFGAHPVNLLEGRKKEGTETIRYASWPTSGIYQEYDYAVLLYSGRKGFDDVPFGFKVKELKDFFESRYKYLEEIEKSIERMVEVHCEKKKSKKIKEVKNPIEQLQILKAENDERLNNDYYGEIIHSLTVFFQTEFADPQNTIVIKKFTDIMHKGIDELYINISDMEVRELSIDVYLHPNYPRGQHFGYSFGKLSECAFGFSSTQSFLIQEVVEPLKSVLSFNYGTIQELYWLTIIALNIKSGNL